MLWVHYVNGTGTLEKLIMNALKRPWARHLGALLLRSV